MNTQTKRETLPVATSGDAGSIMAVIAKAASDPATDVDKLERLLGMFERIKATEAKAAYTASLAEMQPKLPAIDANGAIVHNGKTISQYAKWEDINDVIKPILAAHGFTLDFATAETVKGIAVTAMLEHAAGHGKQATVPLPLDTSGAKNPVQAVGSSLTYGKRYAAGLVLNITSRAPDERDDDGRRAGAPGVVTAEQAAELDKALKAAKGDLKSFLEYYDIESLSDLPAAKLKDAQAKIALRAAAAAKPAKADAK